LTVARHASIDDLAPDGREKAMWLSLVLTFVVAGALAVWSSGRTCP